jgi:hypothetical protein
MTDTLAYQIGAVFFLAVLFMAGTLTRDIFPPGLFKNAKAAIFVVAAILGGFAVYHSFPDLSRLFDFDFKRPEPTAAPPQEQAAPPIAARHSGASRPAVRTREVPVIRGVEPVIDPELRSRRTSNPVADPPQSVVSQSQLALSQSSVLGEESIRTFRPDTGAPPTQVSGNRVKRTIKSVGRFFHIGHEEYRPGQSAPQPASAP